MKIQNNSINIFSSIRRLKTKTRIRIRTRTRTRIKTRTNTKTTTRLEMRLQMHPRITKIKEQNDLIEIEIERVL